jgi:hypothetical protein
MPTSGYLSQSLRRPLPTKDDGILRTVADAAGYMMALSKDPSANRCSTATFPTHHKGDFAQSPLNGR